MSTAAPFDYAVIRVVPRVERQEFINAGVLLFCRPKRFLAAQIALDTQRLLALCPQCQPEHLLAHLNLIPQICTGAGPIGQLSQPERFHWLVTPRSTIIQPSPVHTGLCIDPAATLNQLMQSMVYVSLL